MVKHENDKVMDPWPPLLITIPVGRYVMCMYYLLSSGTLQRLRFRYFVL